MRDRQGPKWLSWWVLLLGVLWAPGSAVAHGVAHQRQAEQRTHHERLEAASRTAHGWSHAVGIEDADHHGDHDDIRSDDGVPSRAGIDMLPLPNLAECPAVRFETAPSEAACVYAARPRADPSTGPPPQLRAPPTV